MSDTMTISNPPAETVPFPELPKSFIQTLKPERDQSWPTRRGELRGMLWYDSIIDDLLAHPGTHLVDTAKRLGRNPNTIYLICGSDLFKARYAQRRKQFEGDLSERLTGKVAKLAEKAVDAMIEKVDKKGQDTPQLREIMTDALDRLGYGSNAAPTAPTVHVHNNNVAAAVSATMVAPASLERARAAMKQLSEIQSSAPGGEVEGSAVRVEEKG